MLDSHQSFDTNCDQNAPAVAVIIPTHNRWNLAHEAITALLADDYPHKTIYLVDDGSIDGTSTRCRENYPEIRICPGDGKLWWGGAINVGIEQALLDGFELVFWLNDDNLVERSTIRQMVDIHLQCGKDTIIASRTVSTTNGEDEWAGHPPRWHPDYAGWTAQPPLLSPSVIQSLDNPLYRKIDHPPGGRGVLIPSSCFSVVGLIDQRCFPHYWADHDFHYRARKQGYRYILAEGAVVWNRPNSSLNQIDNCFSIGWSLQFLFAKRSAMNLPTLRRLLMRHLDPDDYRHIWYPHLWNTSLWLASGWVNRHPWIHKNIRSAWNLINSLRRALDFLGL